MNDYEKNNTLNKVCELINSKIGLDLSENRHDILQRNLISAARDFGFENIDQFFYWLLKTPLNNNQIEQLAIHLTINETYFWREPMVFKALIDYILPEIIEQKKNSDRKIIIWSAGCSSGEEAYSLAIAVHKCITNLQHWNIQIIATDIDQKVLNKAKSGLYREWSFRTCPAWLKNDYFTSHSDGTFEISPEIRNMVRFSRLNLIDSNFLSSENKVFDYDIIFCRNVLMYFSSEWISRISKQFFNFLQPNGWFVVSSCELSSQEFPQYMPVNFNGAILYRKGNKKFKSTIKEPDTVIVHDIPFPVASKLQAKEKIQINCSIIDNYSHTKEQTNKNTSEHKSIEQLSDIAVNIRELANQGNLNNALTMCNNAIEADKLNAGFYFLKASIQQELEKSTEAIASLKQAIYLDSDFLMAHFTLGNLYTQQNKHTIAKKAFNQVLQLLKKWPDEKILPDSEGLSVQYIREIVLSAMHKNTIQ